MRVLLVAAAAVAVMIAPPASSPVGAAPRDEAGVTGWLNWRGPDQVGSSRETGLPDAVHPGGAEELWTLPMAGRGTPVAAAGRVYTMGYSGEGSDLQEYLVCLDEKTGRKIWEQGYNDFLTDTIYSRYALSSPTIDPQSGNIYAISGAGLLDCLTPDGQRLWQRSLMEENGRLSFPNGRTGSVVIDDDLALVHVISGNWGPLSPARDRFYAFDKVTGESVWVCTPGESPKDSSFSRPILEWRNGRRVLYAGTGCGNMVCIDVNTGDPIWRFKMSVGGVNSSAVLHGDMLIAVHGKENVDSSVIGRMVAIRLGAEPKDGEAGPVLLGKEYEKWRNDLVAFTSSPVLVGDRVYLTDFTGNLSCVNADTGKILWQHKLAPDQIHASPLAADGKLYVPMNNGSFHIIKPGDEGPNVLQSVQLEGNCLGAPAVHDGRIYVHTTSKLYCFGVADRAAPRAERPAVTLPDRPKASEKAVRLQIVPADITVQRGDTVDFRVRSLDAHGLIVDRDVKDVTWAPSPGLALEVAGHVGKVKADGRPGVGILKASAGPLTGTVRVRVAASLPFREDFEGLTLSESDPTAPETKFANAPPYWIGASKKWEVRALEGNKVLSKTLDNALFQRTLSFFGTPEMSDYTFQVDIMSDGNRRMMSSAGVLIQRYQVELKGNHQEIEVSSNMERIKESVKFKWTPDVWYTLKARVDVAADGSGVVRAKAWKRGEPEPEQWNIEVPHRHAHTHGAPGLYGFAPQSRFKVHVDNIVVTPNE